MLGFDQLSAEVFVNLATGATLPDAGEVLIFGRPTAAIADSADWLATVDRFGIVSERAVLLDQLTVIQNLAMPFTLAIEPPSDEVRARAETLATEVGSPGRILDACCRGSWSRRATARHVSAARWRSIPPFSCSSTRAPDWTGAEAVDFAAHIRTIAGRRGLAVVVVTADEAFALAVADRVLTLEPATGRLRRGAFALVLTPARGCSSPYRVPMRRRL